MNLTDKVVVVTGGSDGFGKALAQAFAKAGSKVVIASHEDQKLQAAAKELGVDACLADVREYDQVQALTDYATKKYRQIDIWVNNAGIQIAPSNVEDVDLEKLHNLLAINYFGYFYGCKAVLPDMKKRGEGLIVNINSTAGLDGKPQLSAYVSSKFAVKGLTESVRAELKGSDVQIHGIFPGGMQTDIYHEKVPADISSYMSVDHAIEKVMANLASDNPEKDLIIRRPSV